MAYAVLKDKHFCKYCGWVDREYDENAPAMHEATAKHNCNRILYEYKLYKSHFFKNRDGICLFVSAVAIESQKTYERTSNAKIIVHVKPQESAKFYFHISNELKNEDVLILGIQLAHPQPHFIMNKHPYVFNEEPRYLQKKSSIMDEVSVTFRASDIGQYEMPIMITFHTRSANRDIIFIREMVVMVDEFAVKHPYVKNPYTDESFSQTENILSGLDDKEEQSYKIPKLLKIVLPKGLGDEVIDSLPKTMDEDQKNQISEVVTSTRAIFDEGLTVNNYMNYFHHLLWWEEIIARINIRKFNMHGVTITRRDSIIYMLDVPGLAEKRPSLIRGDYVYLLPHENQTPIFSFMIKHIEDSCIHICNTDNEFSSSFKPDALFDVRFISSRVSVERCHDAVFRIFSSQQQTRVFPEPNTTVIPVRPIIKFYNPHIKRNLQQKTAVEHIVAGTSGLAPYIVFGPPGTGKTMTIVEAIIQLVVRNANNRVLVCTDSNMAADHIALTLSKYNSVLNIQNFILRANSQTREWSMMPKELIEVSNGSSIDTFVPVTNLQVSKHRIVVTTLLHSAKYAYRTSGRAKKVRISHLFIDEAGQASEPATLVPVCGLLETSGHLVLAGDPRQLGPVCRAHEAAKRGLGISLLERLYTTYTDLYNGDPRYITKLVNNFRSHPDILSTPNILFYNCELQAQAPLDPLSNVSVLGDELGARAIVFHAVSSREQKMGSAPSFFNEKELEMLKRYVKTLIEVHGVLPRDIGVIAPYIRQYVTKVLYCSYMSGLWACTQKPCIVVNSVFYNVLHGKVTTLHLMVYKMKAWLNDMRYDSIEVGTVEAFQGKEKRVILVSTVRANCKLLDYDAKYNLGFLVDDKRFNVAVTRAKAKLIVIGNEPCLRRDIKWRGYIKRCRNMRSFLGEENVQIPRDSIVLHEIAKAKFETCRLTYALRACSQEAREKKNKKKLFEG